MKETSRVSATGWTRHVQLGDYLSFMLISGCGQQADSTF